MWGIVNNRFPHGRLTCALPLMDEGDDEVTDDEQSEVHQSNNGSERFGRNAKDTKSTSPPSQCLGNATSCPYILGLVWTSALLVIVDCSQCSNGD